MASNCNDLALLIFRYLTVRSLLWPHNYCFENNNRLLLRSYRHE